MDDALNFASESGHWYTRTGEPCYTILGANGKERATTLRDARKLSLVPSVTGIIGCAAKPGLEQWKAQQLMLAALTLPRHPEEPETEWLFRVKEDSQEQARKARERGEAIHGAIERQFRGQAPPEKYQDHVLGVVRALDKWCGEQVWMPEKSFASPYGYGGKVDLHSEKWLFDYKSKEFSAASPPELYEEHFMQLAAYINGMNLWGARCGIIWVSASEPGLVVVNELSPGDLARGLEMFTALCRFWWAKNGSKDYRAVA